MGVLRLLISLAVVIGHFKITIPNAYLLQWFPHLTARHIAGAIKVNAFFIIAGFYTQLMLEEKYGPLKSLITFRQTVLLFYYSRVVRLLPCFYLVMGITSLLVALAYYFHYPVYGGAGVLRHRFFLNYFLLNPRISIFRPGPERLVYAFYYYGPMWALTVELIFMLLAPWFLSGRGSRQCFLAVSLALMVFCLVTKHAVRPYIESSLIYFVIGSFAYSFYRKYLKYVPYGPIHTVIAYLWVALLALYIVMFGHVSKVMGVWTAYACFIGIFSLAMPFIIAFTRHIRLDRYIGDLAYPIYLSHEMFLFLGLGLPIRGKVAFGLGITLLFAVLVNSYIDRPLGRYRARLLSRVQSGKGFAWWRRHEVMPP